MVRPSLIVGTVVLSLAVVASIDAGETKTNTGGTIKHLPEPNMKGTLSVEEAINARRSIRSFSGRGLADEQLSQLLFAAQGITEKKTGFRTVPSAGATYPLEMYVVVPEGVFHYLPGKHALETIKEGDLRKNLRDAALGQSCIGSASAIILLAAVFERTTNRYGRRGVMYVHMEAGHAAQNIHLQALSLGLGSVSIGAFDGENVRKSLGIPKGEMPIYLIPVGEGK